MSVCLYGLVPTPTSFHRMWCSSRINPRPTLVHPIYQWYSLSCTPPTYQPYGIIHTVFSVVHTLLRRRDKYGYSFGQNNHTHPNWGGKYYIFFEEQSLSLCVSICILLEHTWFTPYVGLLKEITAVCTKEWKSITDNWMVCKFLHLSLILIYNERIIQSR